MIRTVTATLIGTAVVLSAAPLASADPPVRVVREVYVPDVTVPDDFLSELCGFPVTASLKGHYFETVFVRQGRQLPLLHRAPELPLDAHQPVRDSHARPTSGSTSSPSTPTGQ